MSLTAKKTEWLTKNGGSAAESFLNGKIASLQKQAENLDLKFKENETMNDVQEVVVEVTPPVVETVKATDVTEVAVVEKESMTISTDDLTKAADVLAGAIQPLIDQLASLQKSHDLLAAVVETLHGRVEKAEVDQQDSVLPTASLASLVKSRLEASINKDLATTRMGTPLATNDPLLKQRPAEIVVDAAPHALTGLLAGI